MPSYNAPFSAQLTRRGFAASGLAALAASQVVGAEAEAAGKANGLLLKPGATILFQGDSITDAKRSRDVVSANLHQGFGNGYAWLAASQLLVDRADDGLRIYNRGISGNKIDDLAARWQAECLDLKPDVLSILIGVNDIWHTLEGRYEGTVEKYETGYQALVKLTKEKLPNVALVICEPFLLRCGVVDEKWFPEFGGYRAAAKRVADAAGAIFVPYQEVFDRASKIAPPERWAADGVHPTTDGAALMAHTWRRTIES